MGLNSCIREIKRSKPSKDLLKGFIQGYKASEREYTKNDKEVQIVRIVNVKGDRGTEFQDFCQRYAEVLGLRCNINFIDVTTGWNMTSNFYLAIEGKGKQVNAFLTEMNKRFKIKR